MPLRLLPYVVLGVGVLAGLYALFDAIGDAREAKVVARYEERDRQAAEKARLDAEAAEAARETAMRPGSLARLRAEWCRDCEDVR